MKTFFIFHFSFFVLFSCWAQQPDSIRLAAPLPDSVSSVDTTATDSAEARKNLFGFFTKDYPNPRKAALLSLVVPGAGQIYNKRWWKVPLVYGAMGGMVYTIRFNQTRYRQYRTAYQLALDGEPHQFSDRNVSTNTLRLVRDRADKNLQLSYIGLVVVHGLQAMEAFVDAHLKTFDVNEDLSLQLKPSLQNDGWTGQPTVGIGVALSFK
jgi:hypothetical protein